MKSAALIIDEATRGIQMTNLDHFGFLEEGKAGDIESAALAFVRSTCRGDAEKYFEELIRVITDKVIEAVK